MTTLFTHTLSHPSPLAPPCPQRNAVTCSQVGEVAVEDLRGACVLRRSGVVVDAWTCRDRALLGVDVAGRYAFFSEDFSWNLRAYDLTTASWLDEPDPDFPRLTLEEDGDRLWIHDAETGCRHRLVEAQGAGAPQLLTA